MKELSIENHREEEEALFLALVSCLLSLGTNYEENISTLVNLCGQKLWPNCVSYHRIQDDRYELISRWSGHYEDLGCQKKLCSLLASNDGDVVRLRPHAESSEECLVHRIRCSNETRAILCIRHAKDMGPVWGGNTFLGLVVSACEAEERRFESHLALQSSEEKFKTIFNSCCAGILIAHGETRKFIYANPAICRFLGYTEEEMLSLSVDDIHPKESVPYVVGEFEAQMRGEKIVTSDIPCKRKDGTTCWADISSGLVTFNGRPCVIGSFSDTTAKRALTQKLVDVQKMEAIGKLAGGVAHGFNNILCPVLGYTELGLQEVPKDSKVGEYLRLIHSAAKESATLTRQLLSYSQKQVLKLSDVDIVEETRLTADFLSKVIGEQVSVFFETSIKKGYVEVDTSLFHQVLLNLAINAKEAITEDGTLSLRCSSVNLDERMAIDNGLDKGGEYIVITVEDSGAGMDHQTCLHVFEPFFTTKGVGEGTGLALAMVSGILKQHGGSIEVESQLDKGTTFTMYWPKSKSQVSVESSLLDKTVADPASITILVVEDDLVVRTMAQRMLEHRGYKVALAGSGTEALQLVDDGLSINLLLTDVVMPEMSGKELYDELRVSHPHLSAVYMSGYANEVLAKRKIDKDAAFFVQKPFTVNELLQVINSCLARK